MADQIDPKALVDELKKILTLLKSKGLIKADVNIEKTAQTVADNLIKNGVKLTLSDVQSNVETKKLLGMACINESINKPVDYRMLFLSPLLQIDEKLAHTLKLLFKPAIDKKNESEKELIDEKLYELSKTLNKLRPEFKEPVAKSLVDAAIKLDPQDPYEIEKRYQRIADYGVDTENPGAVIPILQFVFGDQVGRQDLATSGDSFKGQEHNPNTGGEDPLGIKATSAILSLMTAVIDTPKEANIAEGLANAGVSLYDSPKPSPLR